MEDSVGRFLESMHHRLEMEHEVCLVFCVLLKSSLVVSPHQIDNIILMYVNLDFLINKILYVNLFFMKSKAQSYK